MMADMIVHLYTKRKLHERLPMSCEDTT